MTVYLLAQITIHDREKYAAYEAGFLDIFARYKGTALVVDEEPEVLEGDWPCTRTVVLEFPSRDDALAWYQSDAYQALAKHRYAASVGNIVILKKMD